MSFVAADVDNILLRAYDVIWDDVNLGLVEDGDLSVTINGETVVADSIAQISGVVKEVETGQIPEVTITFSRSDPDFVQNSLLKGGRVETATSGSDTVMFFDSLNRDITADFSFELRLHPTGVATSDRSGDFTFFKSAPVLDDFTFVGSRTEFQKLTVTFRVYPDLTKTNNRYGALGDAAVVSAPLNTFIQCNTAIFSPAQHLTALTLAVSQLDKIRAWGFFGANDATAAFNNVAGFTSTITTLAFDGLSQANAILVNDYLTIVTTSGNERIFVVSIVYTTSTTGTLTVIRGVAGSDDEQDAGIDDAVITRLKDVSFTDITQYTVFASSSASNVTVGTNSDSTTQEGKPGVLENVATGSANITHTLSAIQSPNLVVTAT